MYRSDILIDKFSDDNAHRCSNLCIYPHQIFMQADGEQLPFREKAFDYVICNQVLEHVDDPEQFLTEVMRVGHRGYIETPSLLGELMFPKESHKWVILLLDGKLIFYDKTQMPGNYQNNYGELFLNYLPYQSLAFKILTFSEPNLLINRLEWSDKIDFLVNPTDDYYSSFFTRKWDREMTTRIFPPRKRIVEIGRTIVVGFYIAKEKLTQKFRHAPITLQEYNRRQQAQQNDNA